MSTHDQDQKALQHPIVIESRALLEKGKMSRREFVRNATLLGVSATAAFAMAHKITGEPLEALADNHGTPKPGGVLRCAMALQDCKDPATFDWVEKSNVARHQQEFLAITGPDNVTRPMLAESWSASDDLKTWTFNIRKGVYWHNGDELTAEHVAFNFRRWLDEATGSSNIGLFAAMVEEYDTGEKDDEGKPKMGKRMIDGAVEVVDTHTLRLNLSSAVLSMPENLYNYPTAILHPSFSGDIVADKNGTGAYQIVEHKVGERAVLKKAEFAKGEYWGASVDHIGPGYLDEIHYYHFEPASQAMVTAVLSGQVDMNYEVGVDSLEMARIVPEATLMAASTAQTGCLRFNITQKPFDDVRVRRALQLCCDPAAYPELIFQGAGVAAEHHHVAQIHPEYFPLKPLTRDIEQAKKLLAEAGYPDGIEVTLDCGNTSGPWQQQACEIFKEQAVEAGVNVNINLMPASKYWEIWATTPFGLTQWTHRPLGTMVLSLGYRSGVPWNETAYANPEFDAALDQAEALLDVEKRRAAMEKVEQILQDDAVMIQPIWLPIFFLVKNSLKNVGAHPTLYHQFNKVWIDA
ncbi:MAG: ABC transporter substrate-binding protein [Neomegalonema sp.]|nr:ABC transporter substrate-binding protein [Neomegalonema sp.]